MITDAPSLHASELYSRILELFVRILLAHKVAQLLEKQSLLASIKTGEENLRYKVVLVALRD